MNALLCAVLSAAALGPLSPADAVRVALDNNPQQAVLEANLEEERAESGLALRLENPELRLGDFRSDRLINPLFDGTPYEAPFEDTRLGIRWKPPKLQDFGPRQMRAKARVAQRQAEQSAGRLGLAANVRALHAQLRNLEQRIELATVGQSLADKMRETIRARASAGVSTQLDTSLSELEYLDASADLEELRAKYRLVRQEFLAVLGLPADTAFSLIAPTKTQCRVNPSADLKEIVAQATERSPKVHAVDARIEEVEAELLGTWLAFAPWFDFVQIAYSAGEVDDPGHARVRLGITLPLFDFQRDDAAVLRARRARHKAERRAAELEIGADIRRSADDLKSQAALVDLYAKSQREVLDQGLIELEQALERGDADLVEVALLRTRVLRAKRALLRTELECEEAAIKLALRTGTVLEGITSDAPQAID